MSSQAQPVSLRIGLAANGMVTDYAFNDDFYSADDFINALSAHYGQRIKMMIERNQRFMITLQNGISKILPVDDAYDVVRDYWNSVTHAATDYFEEPATGNPVHAMLEKIKASDLAIAAPAQEQEELLLTDALYQEDTTPINVSYKIRGGRSGIAMPDFSAVADKIDELGIGDKVRDAFLNARQAYDSLSMVDKLRVDNVVKGAQISLAALAMMPAVQPAVTPTQDEPAAASSPAQTVPQSSTWHGVTEEQLAATNLDYSLKEIHDPELQRLVASYAATDYFDKAFHDNTAETNRLWPITTAAGVQKNWDNQERRAKLMRAGIQSPKDAYLTLVLFAEYESMAGTRLGNPLYSRVYGLWHQEDRTWLSAVFEDMTAEEFGFTSEIEYAQWEKLKKFHKEQPGRLTARDKNGAFLNAIPDDVKEARDRVLKACAYGMVASQTLLMLMAENHLDLMRKTGLDRDDFSHIGQRAQPHVLGYGSARALASYNDKVTLGNRTGWRAIARSNAGLFFPKKTGKNEFNYNAPYTAREVKGAFTNAYFNTALSRLKKRGWDLSREFDGPTVKVNVAYTMKGQGATMTAAPRVN